MIVVVHFQSKYLRSNDEISMIFPINSWVGCPYLFPSDPPRIDIPGLEVARHGPRPPILHDS